jgi:hypothetical protein
MFISHHQTAGQNHYCKTGYDFTIYTWNFMFLLIIHSTFKVQLSIAIDLVLEVLRNICNHEFHVELISKNTIWTVENWCNLTYRRRLFSTITLFQGISNVCAI